MTARSPEPLFEEMEGKIEDAWNQICGWQDRKNQLGWRAILRAFAREILLPVETARDDWKRTAEACAEEAGEHMIEADRLRERLNELTNPSNRDPER